MDDSTGARIYQSLDANLLAGFDDVFGPFDVDALELFGSGFRWGGAHGVEYYIGLYSLEDLEDGRKGSDIRIVVLDARDGLRGLLGLSTEYCDGGIAG